MQEKFTRESNKRRTDEVAIVRSWGDVIGTVVATRDLLLGAPLHDVLRLKDDIKTRFDSKETGRKELIKIAQDAQNVCLALFDLTCPNSRESTIAFETKKLTLLSKMIKNGIAEGKVAVEATDFLMGSYNLGLDQMEIVKELNK